MQNADPAYCNPDCRGGVTVADREIETLGSTFQDPELARRCGQAVRELGVAGTCLRRIGKLF